MAFAPFLKEDYFGQPHHHPGDVHGAGRATVPQVRLAQVDLRYFASSLPPHEAKENPTAGKHNRGMMWGNAKHSHFSSLTLCYLEVQKAPPEQKTSFASK